MENYQILLDRRSNGVLIKKGNKLIQMIALPPKEGCYLIRLIDENYECDFEGLVVRRSTKGSFLYYKGELLDIKKHNV